MVAGKEAARRTQITTFRSRRGRNFPPCPPFPPPKPPSIPALPTTAPDPAHRRFQGEKATTDIPGVLPNPQPNTDTMHDGNRKEYRSRYQKSPSVIRETDKKMSKPGAKTYCPKHYPNKSCHGKILGLLKKSPILCGFFDADDGRD